MNPDSDSRCDTKVLPPRLATGQCLKHFQLESVLGQGGMGVVYRAQDTQLLRPVAVKVLPAALTSEADRKQRFLLEARAAARINHPAVAQIYYVDEQDGITFLVMELVEGKTLRDLIQAGALDLLGAIDIAIQVAEGLAKAHELGIIHRDIKPANIMVTNDSHAKILDFGLAKLIDRNLGFPAGSSPSQTPNLGQTTVPGVVMGTAAYMSPEQVRGVAVDCRADIFSMGVVLFEMATGQSPFQRASFLDSLHAVAFDETPPLASIRGPLPDELQRIISRCLKKQPEDRYPDARLLARDLRQLRRNAEAGLSTRTSWRVRMADAWDQLRHLRPSQYLGVTLALAAVGLAVYFSLSRISTGGLFALIIVGLLLYRNLRNRPQRLQERFVQRISRIPEVRLIAVQQGQFTVVVERPVAKLYSRINHQLKICNKKLYFGPPMTVSILSNLSAEKIDQILCGPGVQYVREDVAPGVVNKR